MHTLQSARHRQWLSHKLYKRNVLNLHGYTGTACNRLFLQVFCKVKTDFQEAGLYISYNKITLGLQTGLHELY